METGFAQETARLSRSEYLFTQFRVVLTYFRLLLAPIHQNLDYDYPIFHSLFEPQVFLSFLLLAALLGLALYFVFSASSPQPLRMVGFGALWFFLTLSVESSIIPIRDVIFEHRLYLPSVGFFLAAVTGATMGLQRLPPAARRSEGAVICSVFFAILILSLSWATYQRNGIWRSGVTLWEDVVSKAPKKVRGRNNLGIQYKEAGRLEDAIQEYQIALTLKPDFAEGHNNLGTALEAQGKVNQAIDHYASALRLNPDYLRAHMNLGLVLGKQGREMLPGDSHHPTGFRYILQVFC